MIPHNLLMAREEAALRWRFALGAYVRGLRLDKNLTQDEVGAQVGWHNKQVLSDIETGRTSIPTDRIGRLRRELAIAPQRTAKTG
jgi:transcriptional regulator with XRE-family HTH domain